MMDTSTKAQAHPFGVRSSATAALNDELSTTCNANQATVASIAVVMQIE